MPADLAFLVGLLDQDGPPFVTQADFDGAPGQALESLQTLGILDREPGVNPAWSCPFCEEGVPYLLGSRYVCNACQSVVDPRHLRAWRLDRESFLRWLAGKLKLQGGVRRIDVRLWQLGTWQGGGETLECFYRLPGVHSGLGSGRLSAYRDVLILYGLSPPPEPDHPRRCRSLLEVLHLDDSLAARELAVLLRPRGAVRFDVHTGALWIGSDCVGEVPVGSKEFYFLRCLGEHLDRFVPYADLKRYVLRQSGTRDTTEEATFCQGLKSRIKKKWVPRIDLLLATTNKADGYRLRAFADLPGPD
jgi:hypothetical protein